MELSDADWTDARWKGLLDSYYAAHPTEHPWTIPEIRKRTEFMDPSCRAYNVTHLILPGLSPSAPRPPLFDFTKPVVLIPTWTNPKP